MNKLEKCVALYFSTGTIMRGEFETYLTSIKMDPVRSPEMLITIVEPGQILPQAKDFLTIIEKLPVKNSRQVNCSSQLLFQDNVKQSARTIKRPSVMQCHQSPTILPRPCSNNRFPEFSQCKEKCNSDKTVQTFKHFIDSRSDIFLSNFMNELSIKWQKCVKSNGTYFD